MRLMARRLFLSLSMIFLWTIWGISAQAQSVNGGVLTSWPGATGAIRIPDGVTEIAENCFYTPGEDDPEGWGTTEPISNTNITSVDFNMVTKIGKNAFKGCSGLSSIEAPVVSSIAEGAFDGCSLVSFSLPRIISLEAGCFANCPELQSVSLGRSLATVGDNPFANTTSLTTIVVESGATAFFGEGGALVRNVDGALLSVGGGVIELTLDDRCKEVATKALYNCGKITKLELPSAVRLGEKSLNGCSSLVELRMPRLETVLNKEYMTMNGVSVLQLVDIHLSTAFAGFDGALPDKEQTTVYVANEEVKVALQKQLKHVRIVVGAPPGTIKNVSIVFSGSEGGRVEAWTTGAIDLVSGSQLAQGTKVNFKAIPSFDHEVERWTLNGKPLTEGVVKESGTKNQYYSIESVQEDTRLEVAFRKLPDGYYVFFRSKAPAFGSITCQSNGSEVTSGAKVPVDATLVFTAHPNKGFRVTDWLKDVGQGSAISYEVIAGMNGKLTYTCKAEDGLDIVANFDRKENHFIVKYSSFNIDNGTLTAALEDGTNVTSGEALPAGSKIVFTAHPVGNNHVEEWQLNGEPIADYTEVTYTVTALNADVEVNVLCREKDEPQHGDKPVIRNGHLISWKPQGNATLPDEVTHIDTGAFEGANEMTSLTLNKNLSYIGERSFLYTTSLGEFIVPADNPFFSAVDGVLYTKDKTLLVAYPAAKKDHTYEIIPSARGIFPASMATCPYLHAVTVAAGNTHLRAEDGILYSIDGATLYYYPVGFTTPKEKEDKITIKDGVQTLARLSMAYHPGLNKIQLPASLKTIEARALSFNPRLTAIECAEGVVPSVEVVGDSAFYYSRSLLAFPNLPQLKSLGDGALALCTELRELHIPAGCSIGKKCFDKCQTLARVFSYSVTPPIVEEDAFADIQFVAEAILTVPVGAKSAYSQAIGWQRFTRIEEVENLAAEMIASEMPLVYATADGFIIYGLRAGEPFALFLLSGEQLGAGVVEGSELHVRWEQRGEPLLLVVGKSHIKLIR